MSRFKHDHQDGHSHGRQTENRHGKRKSLLESSITEVDAAIPAAETVFRTVGEPPTNRPEFGSENSGRHVAFSRRTDPVFDKGLARCTADFVR